MAQQLRLDRFDDSYWFDTPAPEPTRPARKPFVGPPKPTAPSFWAGDFLTADEWAVLKRCNARNAYRGRRI